MLAETIKVKIYVKDSDGKWVKSKNRITLEAGGIYMSDIPEEDE